MIDVGQGDCTLIRLPMNKGNILIDTGGNKDYDLATNTIIPYLAPFLRGLCRYEGDIVGATRHPRPQAGY